MNSRWIAIALLLSAQNLWASPHERSSLDLDAALRIAESRAPEIEAAIARGDAAREARIAAGRLPDPMLQAGLANVPIEGDAAFRLDRERMTQRRLGITQRIPSRVARDADRVRSDAAIELADARLLSTRLEVRRQVAADWITRWSAERRVAALRDLQPSLEALLGASQAAVAGGGSSSRALRIRLAQSHLGQRIRDAEAERDAAVEILRQWLGADADRGVGAAPDFADLDIGLLRHRLQQRIELAPLQALTRVADAEIAAQVAARRPGWSLGIALGDRDPQFGDLLSLEVGVELPLFAATRQNPRIRAAELRQRAALDDLAQARRELAAVFEADVRRWEAARERLHHFQHEHLPLADAAVEAAVAAYRGGQGDLTAVLDAQRDAIEQRLGAVEAEASLAMAWVALAIIDVPSRPSSSSSKNPRTPGATP